MVSGIRREMDKISEYHKLIKFLLSVVGLWPYERTCLAYVKRTAHTSILLLGIVSQLVAFLHDEVYTKNAIVTFVINIIISVALMWIHISFVYRIEFLRKMCDTISHHRTAITDEYERRIIFTNIVDVNAKNRSFATIIYIFVCGLLLFDLVTDNYSNRKNDLDIHLKMYYFSDNPKFSYLSHIHSCLFMVIGTTGLIGPELTSIMFAYHACTLFQIVRYRVKIAFAQSSGISDFEKDKLVMDKLISATKLHKETIKYARQLSDCVSPSFFVLLSLGMGSLSFNLLRLVQSVQQQWELKDLLIQLFLLTSHILCLFLINYVCQIVMDSSSELFLELCNCQWYTASVRTQKLFLFFIHHSAKTYAFLIGGLFVPGFEGMGNVLKMSFSYFTVMQSAPV